MPFFHAHLLYFATEPWDVVASTGQFGGNVLCESAYTSSDPKTTLVRSSQECMSSLQQVEHFVFSRAGKTRFLKKL